MMPSRHVKHYSLAQIFLEFSHFQNILAIYAGWKIKLVNTIAVRKLRTLESRFRHPQLRYCVVNSLAIID